MKLQDLYFETKQELKAADKDSPDLAARRLIKQAAGLSDVQFITEPEKAMSQAVIDTVKAMVERRLKGEPVSRILGEQEFGGLPFKVSEAVLDPRPDTETIIEATFQHFQDKPLRTILDLGTGSGCLIVTLLHEFPDSRGVAVDISESALAIARENADRNGVLDRCTFVKSDWDDSFTADLPSKYDLIVSNPPYIPNQDIANLLDEVKKHDPSLALDGGNDGLDAYKKIIPIINSHLNRDGISLLEIGISQEKDVTRIAANAGLTPSRIHSDLGGIPRVVEISK